MAPSRAFVRRLVVMLMAAACLLIGAGTAVAQDDDDPRGTTDMGYIDAPSRPEDNENDFQKERNDCRTTVEETGKDPAAPDFMAKVPGYDKLAHALCDASSALNHPGDAVQTAADNAWDGKLAGIVREIKDGNPAVIGYTMSLWTKYKLDTDALTVSADGINNIMWQLALAGLAVSLLIGLMRVAASRRQGSGQSLEGAAKGYGQYLLYGALVPALAIPAIMAFDAFADTLINEYVANGEDFSKITDAATIGEEMNPILVLVFVLISLMGSLMMALAMVMRIILLPILIGLMPIFAAWAVGRAGKFTVENAMGVLVS